jgi:hypothetical protein
MQDYLFEKGKVVEKLMFSELATSSDMVAAASSNAYTARLLSTASALEAVVIATSDPLAEKQLREVAWELCQRCGGNVCRATCLSSRCFQGLKKRENGAAPQCCICH